MSASPPDRSGADQISALLDEALREALRDTADPSLRRQVDRLRRSGMVLLAVASLCILSVALLPATRLAIASLALGSVSILLLFTGGWLLDKAGRDDVQAHRSRAANPISGVKSARLIEPAVFAWLYRNDRDWLQVQTAAMERAVRDPQRRVDWDSRDRHLANSVRDVALRLGETAPEQKLRLFQIYQLLPELKAKLSRLDRLPLTRAAIFRATDRSSRR